MNLEKISHSIAIFSNLGVLAGIVFLGVEIQQNTKMTQAQTRDAMTEKQMAFYELVSTDTEAARLYDEIGGFPLERTPEQLRFEWIVRSQFRMWENEWYQYQQGLFEPEEFLPRMELWRGILTNSDEYKRLWDVWRNQHAPDFAEKIDSIFAEAELN